MAKSTDRGGGNARYFLRFGVTALLLVSATLVLVLVVLPQRYVLSAGFRESGLNFPEQGMPFTPLDPVRIAALPAGPTTPDAVVRGPSEIFWALALPLLDGARYREALPLFDEYLLDHPEDDDVRRELAATLISAGMGDEAIVVLRELVQESGDSSLRLLLARTLRDEGRLTEASAEYSILREAGPEDEGLALEWARALAAPERYAEAARVLRAALRSRPHSVALRAELARVHYYTNRLEDALALLDPMSDEELASVDASQLRVDVRAALAEPEVEVVPPPPPTLLERAIAAREDDDFAEARALLRQALLDNPENAETWLALANLLEYELSDLGGAREALLEVERIGGVDAETQLRLALLDEWAGHRREALTRLEALLAYLTSEDAPAAAEGAEPVSAPEVRALIGDLLRYDGERIAAAEQYRLALAEEPDNRRAADGLAAVDAEVAALIDDVEGPRIGTLAFGIGDTDDYGRFDLGGEWTGVRGPWVWGGSVGQRWLSGRSALSNPEDLQGAFFEIAPARWWRHGTLRTSVRLGAQWIRRDASDATFGAGAEYRPLSGGRLSLEYRREPAYSLTATLQSATAAVTQDRVLASLDRAIDERWSVTLQTDAAILDPTGIVDATSSARLQGAATLSRSMTRSWSAGWTATALTYTEASPELDGLRLFWDPAVALSTGPVVSTRGEIANRWTASARVGPAVAFIDERATAGFETVPQLSGEGRLEYDGPDLKAAIDLFYAQARLEGYRTYGVRVSVSTSSWLSQRPGG